LIPKLLGTCNPAKNFVYKDFYLPSKNGDLLPYKQFIQSLVTDNPNISKHYIENLKKLDEQSKRRLLFGDWEYDDDPSVLVDYDKSCDIFTNNYLLGGKKYITCDVARLGNDKTKIRVWDGMRCVKKLTIDKSKLDVVVSAIQNIQREYGVPTSQTIVDEDGVGGGVVDFLHCKGFVNNSKPTNPNYQNLRSECYFKLAEVINSGEMYLMNESPTDRDIIVEELGVIKQKDIDKDGKLAIIPKDEIKKIIGRSPDEADCIMMRMWFEINRIVQPVKNRFIN
jgi:phage terminase large subunit